MKQAIAWLLKVAKKFASTFAVKVTAVPQTLESNIQAQKVNKPVGSVFVASSSISTGSKDLANETWAGYFDMKVGADDAKTIAKVTAMMQAASPIDLELINGNPEKYAALSQLLLKVQDDSRVKVVKADTPDKTIKTAVKSTDIEGRQAEIDTVAAYWVSTDMQQGYNLDEFTIVPGSEANHFGFLNDLL